VDQVTGGLKLCDDEVEIPFPRIDDGPFQFSDESVPVVGVVVQAPAYIEGVLTTLAEVDGHDATERIAAMIQRCGIGRGSRWDD